MTRRWPFIGKDQRDVWLPPGKWVDFWDLFSYDSASGELRPNPAGPAVIDGDRVVHAAAPLDRIPLYMKAGACLPLLPADVDTLVSDNGFAHDADVVTLAERIDAVRHVPSTSGACSA